MQDSIGCAPFDAVFHDETLYGDYVQIDFGDGKTDSFRSGLDTIRHTYTRPGKYSVTFISKTLAGCTDVVTKKDYITVNPTPSVTFTVSDTNVCYQDTAKFFAKVATGVQIRSYLWTFDDGKKGTDTSSLADPVYHFTTTGRHRVRLDVTNIFGCTGTYALNINNGDTALPPAVKIDYATVMEDGSVKLVYNKSQQWNFAKYEITADIPNNFNIVKTTYNVADTQYVVHPPQVDVGNKSYTFLINQENRCGYRSGNGLAHNTIFLQATQVSNLSVMLNWSPYRGWNNKNYTLFRKDETQVAYTLLASLSGNDSLYTDTPVCNHTYTYYIVANDQSGSGFTSASNRVTIPIRYVMQNNPLILIRTTVADSSGSTITSWEPGIQQNIKYYVLDRYKDGFGWQENFALTRNTFYNDQRAAIYDESYQYRVSVMDECGNISPSSNIGTSILLTSSLYNDSRQLKWNRYRMWKEGVSEYHLQLADDHGLFKTIAVLSPNDTTYTDDSSYVNLYNGTCYRIMAIRAGSNGDTSFSNVRCANLDSRIFVPNVFTPDNGDAINGRWGIFSTSINRQGFDKFSLSVYNRWGEEIWHTNDYTQTWDGTYRGRTVEMDVYLYHIKAQGLDGHLYNIKGTVQVIR
jgi:gliding motility-associated-like protein